MKTNESPKKVVITAQLANKRQRLRISPAHFRQLMRIENRICAQLAQLSTDYQGGHWDFYQLSNGGFYMAPTKPEKFTLYYSDNYFEGEVSADAAGIIASLFALNQLACEMKDTYFQQLEQYLKDYAKTHAEAGLIFNAID